MAKNADIEASKSPEQKRKEYIQYMKSLDKKIAEGNKKIAEEKKKQAEEKKKQAEEKKKQAEEKKKQAEWDIIIEKLKSL